MISLVVTTFGRDTLYTRRCLERLAVWKDARHELIVVVHDESVLLGTYLQAMCERGLIDRVIYALPHHGHVRSVNLGFAQASGDYLFNINTDVLVGPGVVEDAAERFKAEPGLGLIGWHYNWSPAHEGSFWTEGDRLQHSVRLRENLARYRGLVDREHMHNIRSSPWSTGRVIRAVGDRRILCANTSFFGIRKRLWDRIGGFDEVRYPHMWADDFLCYGVLDLGWSIANLPPDIRCSQQPHRFDSLTDLAWSEAGEPERHRDLLRPTPPGSSGGHRFTQFCRLVLQRLDFGARMTVVGDPCRIPGRLLRRTDTSHRPSARRGASADVDYVLAGGAKFDAGVVRRLRPGGALIVINGRRVEAVPAIRERTRYRRNVPYSGAIDTAAD